jgi:hypothetical protein
VEIQGQNLSVHPKGKVTSTMDLLKDTTEHFTIEWREAEGAAKPGIMLIEYCYDYLVDLLLDSEAAASTTAMRIECDGTNHLEPELLNFTHLELLDVRGCRWFNLDCENMPPSLKVLSVWCQSNLPAGFTRYMKRLVNMELLIMGLDFIMEDSERAWSLPRLPALRAVEVVWDHDEADDEVKEVHERVATSFLPSLQRQHASRSQFQRRQFVSAVF